MSQSAERRSGGLRELCALSSAQPLVSNTVSRFVTSPFIGCFISKLIVVSIKPFLYWMKWFFPWTSQWLHATSNLTLIFILQSPLSITSYPTFKVLSASMRRSPYTFEFRGSSTPGLSPASQFSCYHWLCVVTTSIYWENDPINRRVHDRHEYSCPYSWRDTMNGGVIAAEGGASRAPRVVLLQPQQQLHHSASLQQQR